MRVFDSCIQGKNRRSRDRLTEAGSSGRRVITILEDLVITWCQDAWDMLKHPRMQRRCRSLHEDPGGTGHDNIQMVTVILDRKVVFGRQHEFGSDRATTHCGSVVNSQLRRIKEGSASEFCAFCGGRAVKLISFYASCSAYLGFILGLHSVVLKLIQKVNSNLWTSGNLC